jgi:hypothetical protein
LPFRPVSQRTWRLAFGPCSRPSTPEGSHAIEAVKSRPGCFESRAKGGTIPGVNLTPRANVQLGAFRGTAQTVEKMLEAALGPEGERNYKVRTWAESITRWVSPKDYLSEILALRAWATPDPVHGPLRYTNDPLHVELVKTPFRVLLEVEQTGRALVDCDDIACILASLGMCLGRKASFVIAGFNNNPQFTHVFCRLLEPKSGKWIVLDPVAGSRELQMLQGITSSRVVMVER